MITGQLITVQVDKSKGSQAFGIDGIRTLIMDFIIDDHGDGLGLTAKGSLNLNVGRL